MSAPRIDATRRDINDAIEVLGFLRDNLEDVHVLAYNRHRAAQADKVKGGSRDYALDTHGDPEARALYADTTRIATKVIDDIIDLSAELRSFLTKGKGGSRKTVTGDCSADEIIDAITARRRRRLAGEYEPTLIAKQPVVMPSLDWRTECETLRTAARKVTHYFAEDHQFCQPPNEGQGRFKHKLLRRYPTKHLSTRERESWRRAMQSVAEPNAAAAS